MQFSHQKITSSSVTNIRFVDFLKNVFESPIVTLEDGIFRAQIQWPFLLKCILEAAVSKSIDRLQE